MNSKIILFAFREARMRIEKQSETLGSFNSDNKFGPYFKKFFAPAARWGGHPPDPPVRNLRSRVRFSSALKENRVWTPTQFRKNLAWATFRARKCAGNNLTRRSRISRLWKQDGEDGNGGVAAWLAEIETESLELKIPNSYLFRKWMFLF